MMRFASLGSGSAGNGTLIEKANTRLLLDCGFTLKETVARLGRLGLLPEQLTGILITHEHDDHAKGVFRLASRYGIPIWMSHGTYTMTERHRVDIEAHRLNIIDSHTSFAIQDIQINPFPVPHDAREPTQFTFTDGQHKLGILTDVGSSTPHIEQMLSGCDALVLECNHDTTLLSQGPYSRALKARVAGRLGHLDNQAAAQLLANIDTSKLRHLIAAHLSQQNNTPDLARQALSSVMGCDADWVGIADQVIGFEWRAC